MDIFVTLVCSRLLRREKTRKIGLKSVSTLPFQNVICLSHYVTSSESIKEFIVLQVFLSLGRVGESEAVSLHIGLTSY